MKMNFNSIFVFILSLVNFVYTAPKIANKAPVLLISLDGFRASKLDEFLANYTESTLKKKFVDVGVKADYVNKFEIKLLKLINIFKHLFNR